MFEKRKKTEEKRIRERQHNTDLEEILTVRMFIRLWREFDFDEAEEYASAIKEFNCLI